MTAMASLALAPAELAAASLLVRAMAPVAREVRNCLLVWLALRGTRPGQRPQVIKALPPLDRRMPLPVHEAEEAVGREAKDMSLTGG
jgi:hypothetical protein